MNNEKEFVKREGFFALRRRLRKKDKEQKETERETIELEKGDRAALLISSFLVIFIPTILVLVLMVVVSLLLFGIF